MPCGISSIANAPLFGDAATWLRSPRLKSKIGFPGVDFNKVYIVTPVDQHDPDPNSMQEFMYIGADPHPSRTPRAARPRPSRERFCC